MVRLTGPSRRQSLSSSHSTRTTQCGLPTDTTVTGSRVPSGISGTRPSPPRPDDRTLRTGGSIAALDDVTKFTCPPRMEQRSATPPLVSTVNVSLRVAAVPQVLGEDAQAVAGFLGLAAVGIEDKGRKSAGSAAAQEDPVEPIPRLRSQRIVIAAVVRTPAGAAPRGRDNRCRARDPWRTGSWPGQLHPAAAPPTDSPRRSLRPPRGPAAPLRAPARSRIAPRSPPAPEDTRASSLLRG